MDGICFVLLCNFLQLAELQRKVRSEISSEHWLQSNCSFPDKQLFDWGMMRLSRPLYGIGDAFAMEADDQFRKKRDAEVIAFHIQKYIFFNCTFIITNCNRKVRD